MPKWQKALRKVGTPRLVPKMRKEKEHLLYSSRIEPVEEKNIQETFSTGNAGDRNTK